nr:hypothetical protein [uncultured Rhodopila sp.]
MPLTNPSSRLPAIACSLAFALSGCAAVPLAEMAASRMTLPGNANPACAEGTGCGTKIAGNGLPDQPGSLGDAFHALTGSASGGHETAAEGSAQ